MHQTRIVTWTSEKKPYHAQCSCGWQAPYPTVHRSTAEGHAEKHRTEQMRVTWKDEDEVDGQPVGPITFIENDKPITGSPGWVTLAEARDIAAQRNIELEIV